MNLNECEEEYMVGFEERNVVTKTQSQKLKIILRKILEIPGVGKGGCEGAH